MEKQIALLDHFLHELGINKIAIIGHGLGALVGLLFTMRYPTVVDRIITVEMPFDIRDINQRLRNASLDELADWLLSKEPSSEPARTDGLKADPQAIQISFDSLELFNFPQRVKNLNTPCLMIYGKNDPLISSPNFDPSQAPQNMHFMFFDQSEHFPMLDDTAGFNRLLNAFLTLQPGESPKNLQLKEEWKRRVR